MFLIIIFSFQFYFLAKVFRKNKLKTVLSAIGLCLLGSFIMSFIFMSLILLKVIDLNPFDSKAILEYMYENNIQLYAEIILFILIGVIYYNYIKRKWMKEVLTEKVPIMNEIKEQVTKMVQTIPVKTNYYTYFHQVNEKNIHVIPQLAEKIWNVCYKDIISQEQIDYMLEMMYNQDKISEGIATGEKWEILKADNEPVGYIHYKIENDKVFLSKIYLLQDEKYKGLGQVMMNHVIEFALENKLNAIYLTVNKNNAKAIKFYEKNGFQIIKTETFDIGNGFVMDDFILEKEIKHL